MDATGDRLGIGIGLPAAVPGCRPAAVGEWAERAEGLGFESSTLDRVVYDNLDPLIALAAAAERTHRVELLTTVLNVPVSQKAVVVAKQLHSLDRLSGGRLTAGLALGGWPEDYSASRAPAKSRGATLDRMVAFDGATRARAAWASAGRPDPPRIALERYFCLADGADPIAGSYIAHYYGLLPLHGRDLRARPARQGARRINLIQGGTRKWHRDWT
jgi:alkanesulfonate monooxygenase SsuD/methylene tetrahydromethanopterin reductase-like flavin-dependent oxidoreductase (luciferase family)